MRLVPQLNDIVGICSDEFEGMSAVGSDRTSESIHTSV